VGLLLRRSGDDESVVLAADGDIGMELAAELALGPFDRQAAAVDRHVHAGRDRDWESTDS
jgi:hypothetical protein